MEIQDRTFYPDDIERLTKMENSPGLHQLKRKMTLDFNTSSSIKTKQQKMANLLQSPDLNLLKLASPELEKMIIQANGMVTTTPTPTQFIFPKYVTDEQEAYARGFVEALANLHKNPDSSEMGDSMDSSDSDSSVSYPNSSNVLSLTTTTSLPGGLVNPTNSSMTLQSNKSGKLTSLAHVGNQLNLRFKEEPQTVPCMEGGHSPPLSPIDMESQERIKLERKRARNRVAARKCRTRKLERISRLEDKVSDLKGQNTDLATTATTLRDQVCKLKQQIIEHVNSGCQIMLSNSINFS